MYCITLQNSLQFGSIVCIVLHWVRGVCPSVISVGITEGRLRVHQDGDDVEDNDNDVEDNFCSLVANEEDTDNDEKGC